MSRNTKELRTAAPFALTKNDLGVLVTRETSANGAFVQLGIPDH